jgi:uncharacterized protein YyaL (SSP411 family)
MRRPSFVVLLGLCAALTMALRAQAAPAWHTQWSDGLFAQAAREHRFVLLDLHAVWCHWCHVMDAQTYSDPLVQSLIAKNYVAVSVDADNDPNLASRYGNWGWPATIVLAADGSEIVKRRGYIPAAQMASLLKAIIDDPSPGPSVAAAVPIPTAATFRLDAAERTRLINIYEGAYDEQYGGWGDVHKFIDAAALELCFSQIDGGNAVAITHARQTLNANLQLIDPVWGGVYQYSDAVDWQSPHFEKLMSFQADDLRLYSEAFARWHDPRYLTAAESLKGYMLKYLMAPDGGFYVSQDADVSAAITGHDFYLRDQAGRRALGMPRIDTQEYAREAGWAIRSLTRYSEITGDAQSLVTAERAANWAIEHRSRRDGSFSHGARDRGGPYLEDALSMAQAFVALYRATGERDWLQHAAVSLNFIDGHLRHRQAGYIAAREVSQGRGVFREPVRQPEQNAALVRVANLAYHYTGNDRYERMARHALKYLVAYAKAAPDEFHAEILLADRELAAAPIHITVVGVKSDPAARALHAEALRYPADYLQVDWWDPSEGPLPNRRIQYPRLDRAAAFACTANACSTPVFDGGGIEPAVRAALAP